MGVWADLHGGLGEILEELAERIERLEAKARAPRVAIDEEIRPLLSRMIAKLSALEERLPPEIEGREEEEEQSNEDGA